MSLIHTLSLPLLSFSLCLRLLEAQLQTQSRQHKDELVALHTQIEVLREDLEKKQEVLGQIMALSPEDKVEFSVQQEITRLTNDNLVSLQMLTGKKKPLCVCVCVCFKSLSVFTCNPN